MERIAIDIMGPLPVSQSGNRFIMVVGDYFTKWMEAYPLPNHRADTVAVALVANFISRFDIPEQLHTDQGTDFQSHLFREMTRILEIQQTRTTPWHPQSDGLIERFNRTLGAMLRQATQDKPETWDAHLPILCMTYRASVNTTTGFTPNKLMLGRELPFPTHLLTQPGGASDQPSSHIHFVEELENDFQQAFKLAADKGAGQIKRQKKEYDRQSWRQSLKEGMAVWLYNPIKKLELGQKLSTRWEDEYYIIKKILSEHVVLIQKNGSTATRVVHVDMIRPVRGPGYPHRDQLLREGVPIEDYVSPLEALGLVPRRSRRLLGLPPM